MAVRSFFGHQSGIVKIVSIYAAVGLLWIYTSDSLLSFLVRDVNTVRVISIYKGSAYVFLTSLLLYFLILRYDRQLAHAEEALRESEQRLRTILESEPECVMLIDAHGEVTMLNRAGVEMLQAASPEEVTGSSIFPLLPPSSRDSFGRLKDEVFGGGSGRLELEVVGKKGRRIFVSLHAVPFRDQEGRIVALLGIARDDTDRKNAEILLNARLKLNTIVAETGLDGMLEAALDEAEFLTQSRIGFFHFMDQDQNRLTLQAWSGNTLATMCTAEGKGEHYPLEKAGVWADCARTGQPTIHNDFDSVPNRKGFPEGHPPIRRELAVPVIREGRIEAIMGVGNKPEPYTELDQAMLCDYASTVCDLAMRKKADLALRESERRYRTLVDNIPMGINLIAADFRIVMVNRATAERLGHPPEWFVGKFCYNAFEKRDSPCPHCPYALGMDRSKAYEFDTEGIRADGSRIFVRVRTVPLVTAEGEPGGFVEVVEDLTERRLMEARLQKRENQYRLLAENMSDVVWSLDLATNRYTYVSPSVFKLRGFTPEEVLAGTLEESLTPASLADFRRWLEAKAAELRRGGGNRTDVLREVEQPRRDGSTVWTEVSTYYMVDGNNVPFEIVGVSRDISERKRAEQERQLMEKQMLHVQKLESLGVLAGGIAHDFNNILMAIIGNADLALRNINQNSPAVENLQRIESAAAQAADLAKQMLAYSGKGKFVVEHLDLNSLLEEMLHMLEVSISKHAVLRLNLARPLPSVEADATQIRQIIMNLVINASEAIGERSGTIAITTGCLDCDRGYLNGAWLNENISAGLYVFLEIADTGCGMDSDTISRIFDPFFTTKFTGRGLGMAAVLGIVRGHKGAIKVYSEPGRGSSFKILLPASDRPAELFSAEGRGEWSGSGKVLLVDDEETVRGIGREMLQALGYEVVTASNGVEALALFREDPQIRYVLLDLTMPHMDGEKCFSELRRIRSDAKVIMSSGYNEQEVTQRFLGKGLAGFIQKPYKVSDLAAVFRKLSGSE